MSHYAARTPKRHFTVTTFITHGDRTLLHFHAMNRMWLPPGGHIDPNEDPVQAARREAKEETGLAVEILPSGALFAYATPPQLPAPVTIMIEDIPDHPIDGPHRHIDLIYFTRPRFLPPREPPPGWRWVTAADLAANLPLAPAVGEPAVEIPEDVRVLAIAAIDRSRDA